MKALLRPRTAPCALALAAALTAALAAHAQTAAPLAPAPANPALTDAAQKAISTNPEVTARYNALRAATNQVDVARGGLFPRLDLQGEVGRDWETFDNRNPESDDFNRSGVALNLRQLLWDGLATSKEVSRLGHARLVRYFEFFDATEQTALEASRAYYDVQRFRKLVEYAEDNYVQHKYTFDQLQSRFKAGVGRGVDLEQTNARLALADANLTTEAANLHDVTARYLRIVGEAPTALPKAQLLAQNLPASMNEAVNVAINRNAAVSAAIENLRAAQEQAGQAKSRYQPTVEARVRSGMGSNFDGVQDQKRDTTAAIVLNWNLFNGGSDQARVRQTADLLNEAADQRDKACRDVRQTVAIAYNDIARLQKQLVAQQQNVLSSNKTRDAYRQQFDIGQRSLLDLLNSENELYTAKRDYAMAEHDLGIAYLRTHAALNTLGQALGLTRAEDKAAQDTAEWQAGNDAATRCPVADVQPQVTTRTDLDARAAQMAGATPITGTVPAGTPANPQALPAPETITTRLNGWAAAWRAKDVAGYMAYYSPEFKATTMSSKKWLSERRRLVGKNGAIDLKIDNVQTKVLGPNLAETRFEQTYVSDDFKDKGEKVLRWKLGKDWQIVSESNR